MKLKDFILILLSSLKRKGKTLKAVTLILSKKLNVHNEK